MKIDITSFKNEKIKKIIKLRNKNKRDKFSLFLIEGYRELLRAQRAKIEIESLFICPSLFLKDNEYKLIKEIEGRKIYVYNCTEDVFRKISYRDRPDGLIAIAKQFHQNLKGLEKKLKKKKDVFLVICEGIEKPGNLGTILRSCDAAKVDALIIANERTDIFNPNVVRASTGTLFTVPIIEAQNEDILAFLKKNKIKSIASSPHAKKNYTKIDMKKSLAILVGTEQVGLTDFWLKNCDQSIKIPMYGVVDSLNVAQATTILLYETIRQRKL